MPGPPGSMIEIIKQAIAASLGCEYIAPTKILAPIKKVTKVDANTGEASEVDWDPEGTGDRNVWLGIEAMAKSSMALANQLMLKAQMNVVPGMIGGSIPGPVTGIQPMGSGWLFINTS